MRTDTLTVPLNSTRLDVLHLPLSRAAAVQSWSRALWTVALVQVFVLSIHGAFQERAVVPGDMVIDPTIHALIGAVFLPLALISLVRHAEKRLLQRPPKIFLASQVGLYVGGSFVATFDALNVSGTRELARFWIGHGVLGISVLLVAAWFTGVFLSSSGEIAA